MDTEPQQLPPPRPQFLWRDPLLYAGIMAILGVLLAHCLNWPAWIWTTVALAAALPAIFHAKLRWLALITFLGGFAGLHGAREFGDDRVAPVWQGQSAESVSAIITGTVVERPRPPRRGDTWRLTVRLDSLEARGIRVETHNRIHVFVPTFLAEQGERIVAEGQLRQLPAPRNPSEFSRRDYARDSEGVVAEMSLSSRFRLKKTGVDWWYRVFHHAFLARNAVGDAITRGLQPPSGEDQLAGRPDPAQILRAMVLGEREEIDPELEEPFRLSGALHIFAVSGLHVGIFGTVIWFILRTLGMPRRHAIFFIIVCVAAYAFITGLRPSAVRAAIMTSVFLAGFCLRRQSRLLNSLGFAAICILAVDSRQLFGVGFQLSFAVLASISLLTPPLSNLSRRWLSPDPFIPNSLVGKGQRLGIKGGQRVCDVFWVSLAASAGSAGFIWWYFGLLTPVALLANCALVPLAWFVICFATVSLVASGAHLFFVSTWLNQLNGHLVLALHGIATFFAQVPYGHFETTPLADRFKGRGGDPGIVVFDLGRSCGPQAIHIKEETSGRSRTWLIDSGDESRYGRTVRPWLLENRILKLDGFIATHGDIDHLGGAPNLIKDFRPAQLIQNQFPSTSKAYKALEQFKNREDMATLQLSAGARIKLGEEAAISVLFPPPDWPDQSAGDDECLVLLVEWRGWKILNMSDSGFRAEKWLLDNLDSENLRADVLIKSQHASDFSGLAEFIRAVAPKAVIATNDTFPANEAISDHWRKWLADSVGIPLFDQAECGAVTFSEEDGELVLRGFVNEQTVVIP